MPQRIKSTVFFLAIVVSFFLSGCETMYFNAMEKVGYHKRDILVSRVEDARESQEDAEEEFKSALAQFQSVVAVAPSELQSVYEDLSGEFEDAESAAKEVSDRIDAIESVSDALFDEWQDELEQYTSSQLRRQSAAKMKATRKRYQTMINAMRRAEDKMTPVLNVFRDQVLYLKHNLNAQSVAALKGELVNIETNVDRLIKEMRKSITESNKFIASLEG